MIEVNQKKYNTIILLKTLIWALHHRISLAHCPSVSWVTFRFRNWNLSSPHAHPRICIRSHRQVSLISHQSLTKSLSNPLSFFLTSHTIIDYSSKKLRDLFRYSLCYRWSVARFLLFELVVFYITILLYGYIALNLYVHFVILNIWT